MELKVNDKPIRIRFGQYLVEMLSSEVMDELNAFGKLSTAVYCARLVYYGHVNYCLGYDELPKVTKGEVFQWVEDNNNNTEIANELLKVIEGYKASKAYVEAQQALDAKLQQVQAANAPKKKKPRGQKLGSSPSVS